MACGTAKMCIGDLKFPIDIMERGLLTPEPGFAAPRHDYCVLHRLRAHCKTRGAASQFGSIEINGKRVSHQFTIRYTALAIDTRNRVRDMHGRLYAILSVEDIDEEHKWLKLNCALVGPETLEAAR